jgi:hypothetical protein
MFDLIQIALVTLLGATSLLAEPYIVGIVSEREFCLMLPPQPGQNIGATEHISLSRCMGNVPGSDAVGPLPEGNPSFPNSNMDRINLTHLVKIGFAENLGCSRAA